MEGTSSSSGDGGMHMSSEEVERLVGRTATEAKDKAASVLNQITAAVKNRSNEFINQQKGRLVSEVSSVCNAAREAARRAREDNCTNIAAYADAAADRLQSAADYLQNKPLGNMMDDVKRSAEKHPQLFLGTMLILGLAAGRFMRASSHKPSWEH